MTGKVWTAGDWQPALDKAKEEGLDDLARTLLIHHFHASHCGGWEVAAWPCPPALEALEELYPRIDEELRGIGEAARSALEAADSVCDSREEADQYLGMRVRSLVVSRQLEKAAAEALDAEADSPPNEPGWTVMRNGGWRWKAEVQSANYAFKYRVSVQRSLWPRPGWKGVGEDSASTKWGARSIAKRIRRRHIRRFGED